MSLRFNVQASKLLRVTVATLFVWVLMGTSEAVAQRLPKKTDREPENRPASPRRERPKRQPIQPATRTPASAESNNFFDLGERFREQKKWKAAEAAYKEAVIVWPGNVDALLELGFLYIDRNKIEEAQQTYSKLRSLNAAYASDLLAEINRLKNSLAH